MDDGLAKGGVGKQILITESFSSHEWPYVLGVFFLGGFSRYMSLMLVCF